MTTSKKIQKIQIHCNFCGRGQSEVIAILAGSNVYICDECVNICVDVLKDTYPAAYKPTESVRIDRGNVAKITVDGEEITDIKDCFTTVQPEMLTGSKILIVRNNGSQIKGTISKAASGVIEVITS